MIDNRFHIELNGVKYRLFELADGGHYQCKGEALRPPNVVVEQGGDQGNPRFQMRPDVLLWTVTDWSGGEGQIKLTPNSTGMHWRLNCVDPFTEPGKLMPGPYIEVCVDSGGADPLAKSLALVVGDGKLWGLDQAGANVYEWDVANGKWKAVQALTGPTVGACAVAAGDSSYIYWKEVSTAKIFRYPCTGATATEFNSDNGVTSRAFVYSLGDYLYLHDPSTGKVWEMDKAGTPPVEATLLDDPSAQLPDLPGNYGQGMACPGENRLYTAMTWLNGVTVIREITPTSAAGAGYGTEIARFVGFVAESIWFHSGLVYVSGYEDVTSRASRSILYMRPGGEYGTIGRVRQGDVISYAVQGGPEAQRMLDFGFVTPNISATATKPGLFVGSAITGGTALLGYATAYTSASININNLVTFDGCYFFSTYPDPTTPRTFRTHPTKYDGTNAYAISPWHDFGLVEEKVLQSMRLHCESLPADWTITLSYAINGSSSFTSAGAYATTSGTGTNYSISTSASVKLFRTVQLKIAMTYGGAGVPTTRPKVLGVEIRAAAGSSGLRVWRLLLDCNDEASEMQGASRHGAVKLANVVSAYDADVVSLKDGYRSRDPNVYTTTNVTVDEYVLELMQPGEGTALVTLREVL